MKEWICVEVKHHKDVGETIEKFQKNGWSLYTYQVTGPYFGFINIIGPLIIPEYTILAGFSSCPPIHNFNVRSDVGE